MIDKFRPFEVPKYVFVEHIPEQLNNITEINVELVLLKSVSEDMLSNLCDEFRNSVFERAGKKDPLYKE